MAFRAPLLGYNTNVRHKGKLYHIQTEDSGIDHPHVITHLFADGGRIVASKKTSYAERVGSDGLPDQVKKLMQGQHKAMFISLRDGIFDEDASDDAPEPTTDPRLRKLPAAGDAPGSGSIDLDASLLRSGAEEPRALLARDGASAGEFPLVAAPQPLTPSPIDELDELDVERPPGLSEQPPAAGRAPLYQSAQSAAELRSRAEESRASTLETSPAGTVIKPADAGLTGGSPTQHRSRAEEPRASTTGSGPRSLFGGDLLSDKSLDEVILNYLAANEKDG